MSRCPSSGHFLCSSCHAGIVCDVEGQFEDCWRRVACFFGGGEEGSLHGIEGASGSDGDGWGAGSREGVRCCEADASGGAGDEDFVVVVGGLGDEGVGIVVLGTDEVHFMVLSDCA